MEGGIVQPEAALLFPVASRAEWEGGQGGGLGSPGLPWKTGPTRVSPSSRGMGGDSWKESSQLKEAGRLREGSLGLQGLTAWCVLRHPLDASLNFTLQRARPQLCGSRDFDICTGNKMEIPIQTQGCFSKGLLFSGKEEKTRRAEGQQWAGQ